MAAAVSAAEPEIWATDGECEELIIADENLTRRCQSSLAQILHADGRVDVSTGLGWFGNPLYAFGGWPTGKQKLWSDHAVDRITINKTGKDAGFSQHDVKGQCSYSSATAIDMLVTCQAVDADGHRYVLRYRTDDIGPSPY